MLNRRSIAFLIGLFVTWPGGIPVGLAAERHEGCGHSAQLEAGEGRPFDEVTGADPRNYPPDPQVEFEHIRLDLVFENLASRSFHGRESIRFRALSLPLSRLDLDAVELEIEAVRDAEGNPLSFRHDGERLTVRFAEELAPRTQGEIHIEYRCRNPKAGMIFVLPDEAYPERPLLIHTQGQTEDNRRWFISHDYPNARCTTEVIVTIPGRYTAVSNGRLVERQELESGMVRYHYLQEQPHVSYLVGLAIGELVVVREAWRGIPVEYWVPPGREPLVQRTFGKTPEMLDLFSDLLGMDYPFAKYAQVVCQLFRAGGMENTSATFLHEDVLLSERAALDHDEEYLIAHELAHQWFGNLVTCRSWPHIWINEGFATFLGNVWFEHSRSADEYGYWIWHMMERVIRSDPSGPGAGLVSSEYEQPGELFWRRGSYPYNKGASFIHMLRRELGDEVFWEVVREFLNQYAWKAAETDDFRKVVEELSGVSYERFFHQWLQRPGVPHVRAVYTWDDAAGQARVTLEQTQAISRELPAFVADVEVWLVHDDGEISRHRVPMQQRFTTMTAACAREPVQVVIDPHAGLLAKFELSLPVGMLARQATKGPTIHSRLRAVRALQEQDHREAREALRQVLMDTSAVWGLRGAAADSLGKMQTTAGRDVLLEALSEGIGEHRARRAAVSALGEYRGPEVVEVLIGFAESDPAYGVEAAASEALGKQHPSSRISEILLANAQKSSHHNRIRRSAVLALAQLGDPLGVEPAKDLAAYGESQRSRPVGVEAVGLLGRLPEHRESIRRFLIDLLNDTQERTVRATIQALAALSDKEAIPALETYAASAAPPYLKRSAQRVIDRITTDAGEAATVRQLRERLDQLEKAREAMEKRLSALESVDGDDDSVRTTQHSVPGGAK